MRASPHARRNKSAQIALCTTRPVPRALTPHTHTIPCAAAAPARVALVADRGKGAKEQGNLVVKEAVQACMVQWGAPFRCVWECGCALALGARGRARAHGCTPLARHPARPARACTPPSAPRPPPPPTPTLPHHPNRRPKMPFGVWAWKKGANTRDSTAMSLIRMLSDGPDVSLSGSPTVSPMTAAL